MINGVNELSRMAAYMPVSPTVETAAEALTDKTGHAPLALTAEEIEQKLEAYNAAKAAALLGRSGSSASQSIVQVAVCRNVEESQRFERSIIDPDVRKALEEGTITADNSGVLFNTYYRSESNTNTPEHSRSLTAIEGAESTPENPVFYVASYSHNDYANPDSMQTTWYKVNINQVNPHSATREEMFALITHEYRDDAMALARATNAFGYVEENAAGLGFFPNGDGQMDFQNAIKIYGDKQGELYKGGRADAKDLFDTLMDMIDKMGKRANQQAKPAQASQQTIYHKVAAEMAKV
jgi:hypothetical protein